MPDTPPTAPYPIGTPGTPWGIEERAAWLSRQQVRRHHAEEVVRPLEAAVPPSAELLRYGTLDYTRLGLGTWPLLAVRSRDWRSGRPTVLVTGGVHGYETSGVQGALQWVRDHLDRRSREVNVLVLPCISPWGYETINRWNPDALDPNRQFRTGGGAAESSLAMACIAANAPRVDVHVDLHETTDTDDSEFGPAKAARDGVAFTPHGIPDGFYLVGDVDRPEPAFHRALIDAVRPVTPIAPADADGRLIGEIVQQDGVILYAKRSLGLCGGVTDARFATTTEVYPDSPSTTPERCNAAQVATVEAAITYLLASAR